MQELLRSTGSEDSRSEFAPVRCFVAGATSLLRHGKLTSGVWHTYDGIVVTVVLQFRVGWMFGHGNADGSGAGGDTADSIGRCEEQGSLEPAGGDMAEPAEALAGVRVDDWRQAVQRPADRLFAQGGECRTSARAGVYPAAGSHRHDRVERTGEVVLGADAALADRSARGGEVQGVGDAGQPRLRVSAQHA